MRNYLYKNIRNERKHVEIRRYSDGHYSIKQYIATPTGKNYVGCNLKQNKRGGIWHRITRRSMVELLEDYELEVAV